ncbi:Cytochrome P450 9e2, partial [Dufourea novaeangliae]
LPLVLAAVAVFTAFYYYARRGLDFFKKHDIPHIPPQPLFGNMASFVLRKDTIAGLVQKIYNSYTEAKYVGCYEFSNPIVILRDIDLIKSITIKNFETFIDHRSFANKNQDPLLGGMLFSLKGDEWKESRNQVSPTFTSSKLKAMFTLMSDVAVYFTDYLYRLPEKERELELKTLLTKFTNDLISTCVFGIAVNSIENPKNTLYVNGMKATNFSGTVQNLKFQLLRNWPSLAKLLDIKFVSSKLAKYFENLIVDNMNQRDANGIYRPDMLQYLMEASKKNKAERQLTTEDITSHAFSFFFGGYDTVASQACLIVHDLVEHPEAQERLQQEIDQVLEKTNGHVTYEEIIGMEYLDALLNESMRLHPAAIFLDRVCVKDFELPPALPGEKPFTLKKGMNVWIPVHAIQTDPKHFEDPDKFNPERFLQDGKRIASSGTFIPFGMGPRICIGNRFALLEIKILLFHLFARCNMVPCSRTNIPFKMAKGVLAITAANGFWLKVEPRKHVSSFVNNVAANGTCKT